MELKVNRPEVPLSDPWQVAEKRPSAAFSLPASRSFVVAAYTKVRLTPQDLRGPRERDFARLNLHLVFFEQPAKNYFFSRLLEVPKIQKSHNKYKP